MFYAAKTKLFIGTFQMYIHHDFEDDLPVKPDFITESDRELICYYKDNILEPCLTKGFENECPELTVEIHQIWNTYKDLL